jgi:type III restriction enzyme
MKFKFKVQSYQTQAVKSVVDCFAGQPQVDVQRYRFDSGQLGDAQQKQLDLEVAAFRNPPLLLSDQALLENVQSVQQRQNLPVSSQLAATDVCQLNLDIEMETGTGKTYCYIKTIFELNRHYGWSKFIIVVPSIAIREGVKQSLEITGEHFLEAYGKKARHFVYQSKDLTPLESFSQDAGINVMVINIQAFNSRGADNRRIYGTPKTNSKGVTEYVGLDDFQSRKPIDVISANKPILILDEPQKLEGEGALSGLKKFDPMIVLRYSATHKTTHNKVYRLDALDAFNQKLVKKIAVRGISVKGLSGTNAYLFLERIDISKQAPVAVLELEVKRGNGIKPELRRISKHDRLIEVSGGLEQYQGFVVSQIDARTDTLSFTNGVVLQLGEASGDVNETTLRRIQIREAIKAHLVKEQGLFAQGIKVLSLFFIDHVINYRDYSRADEKGNYALIFEEEYQFQVTQYLQGELPLDNKDYREYLERISVGSTHSGYFSIDKKSGRLTDPNVKSRGEDAGQSDDADAYDLILKNKARLLSFEEPVRFIFSHSALREGWDNPNVFVMCMLKHGSNSDSRRQEVGRGLRLAVNRNGDRMDDPARVHDINVLTVVASESYQDFVSGLQTEIGESLSARPRIADKGYFLGKVIQTQDGPLILDDDKATGIQFYLITNQYVNRHLNIVERYHQHQKAGTLAPLPDDLEPFTAQVHQLINGLFSDAQLPAIADDRKPKSNPLNDNYERAEFKALWSRIHHKAVYQVAFDSEELIEKAKLALEKELRVTPLTYIIERGEIKAGITDTDLKAGTGFQKAKTEVKVNRGSVHTQVVYDLVGKLAEGTDLTRRTVAGILTRMEGVVFGQFKENPEQFIAEASRIINAQKATMIVEHITYDLTGETYDLTLFTESSDRVDVQYAVAPLQKHIRDFVVTDSDVERRFVEDLDRFSEVVVYSKLPKGFLIPTPVGNYNPDWAIAFQEGKVQHIYFVAETKGSLSSLDLRGVESAKIECARTFFGEVNRHISEGKVKYAIVKSWEGLLGLLQSPQDGATSLGAGESAARQVAIPAGLPTRLEVVAEALEERYVSALPLIPLQAAAGGFGVAHGLLDGNWQWVRYTGRHKLREGMFVAQVAGRSMEPLIADGAYCLFRGPVEGARQGKVVLVVMRDGRDPETGERFTVKKYASVQAAGQDGAWQHERVVLSPVNREFSDIVLEGDEEGLFGVIAEFLEVVG